MKKITKMATLIVALIAMAIGMMMPVSAVGDPQPPVVVGTEETPAKAYLSKILNMADGITPPTANFSFVFKGISVDGVTSDTPPSISTKTIDYTAADAKAADANGLVSIKKVTATDLLSGITFPHAGIYKYEITETSGTYTLKDEESMIYSKAKYTMDVHVANKSTTGVYVKYIVVNQNLDDAGNEKTGKVNPSPVVTDNTFTFTNTFIKDGNAGVDHAALIITNTVLGTYGDKTKEFSYELSLTKSPTELSTVTSYTAVIKETGKADVSITFEPGVKKEFKLKDGQSLVFTNLPAGTKYSVVQSAEPQYTPNINITENGVAKSVSGSINTAISTSTRLIGEKENRADFINTNDGSAVTGILDNNLPFVVLIGVTMLGFGGYLFSKLRRNAK